jgi:hypothetical protein
MPSRRVPTLDNLETMRTKDLRQVAAGGACR